MDLEDEAMPYLRLLNENSGNYLLQNSYELQDCLSVEPIFTEIETETWSPECFPVSLNGTSLNESGNVKCITDHVMTEDVQGCTEGRNLNSHIILSQAVQSADTLDNICQKENIHSSSDTSQNMLLSQDSVLQNDSETLNQLEESQQGKQKRTLILLANGNSYELSYSNKYIDPIKLQGEKSNILEELNLSTSELNKQIIQVITPDDHMEQVEDQDVISNTSEISKDEDLEDISDWNEFYSILTAMKCKVCSYLCESSMEMTDHLKSLHGDLLKLKQVVEKEDINSRQRLKMKSLLASNISVENNMTIFICSMCNDIFTTKDLLMEHVKIHNQEPNSSGEANENEITDGKNENPIYSMRNLATSSLKKQQNARKKIKCSVKGCTLKFSSNESKLRHESCHVADKKHFQCPECTEKFSLWRVCSNHLWTCHQIDAGLYTCPICDKYKSNSLVVVMNHMDIHSSERPFVCADCGKGFKQHNQLRNHRVIHNRGEELSPWSTNRKCTICDRIFANTKSLKKHIQSVHEKIKPYICNICGHRTARKAMLELHLRQHTGDKPHHCPHCDYKTADHNSLRKHVMKHYGFMKYSCPYCKYKSIQSSAYKKHLASKHPDANEIFKCEYCTFSSLKYDSYLTHVKCHEYNEEKRKKEKLAENSAVNVSISTIRGENNLMGGSQIDLNLPDADHFKETEDTGGITIPAGCELQLVQ